MLDGSYCSAPYRYVGRVLDAWVFAHVVQLFDGPELVTTHSRAHSRGQWMTRTEHYPPHKAAYLERTPTYCRRLAETVGPSTYAVVEQLLADRPLDRLRSARALLRLMDQVGKTRLEPACKRASHFGDVHYRRIANNLLASAALDRLTHHCHVLVIRGESYQQRGRRKEDRAPDLTPANTPELDSWPTPR